MGLSGCCRRTPCCESTSLKPGRWCRRDRRKTRWGVAVSWVNGPKCVGSSASDGPDVR